MRAISKDNKIIHGMWFGTQLSRLELLTLHSFAHFGHEFHLWAYDDLSAYDLPRNVKLREAAEIIPRKAVFAKTDMDPETGVGRHSFGAPFSDLFRYKLLYEHGGIWVDMDVTCLRPFDFAGDYAFRPHRVGVVGSILKSPARSAFMRKVYEETARSVGPDSEYLLPNRILSKHVRKMGLQSSIIENISNPDHWMDFIRPLIEGPVRIPREWHAIHWINEMWRTLQADGGKYRGRPLFDYIPDKDAPKPGSTLWEMYRRYKLIDPWDGPALQRTVPANLERRVAPVPSSSLRNLRPSPTYLNVLLPSLVRGGAERGVLETMSALQSLGGLTQRLFVVHRSRVQYPAQPSGNLKILFSEEPADPARTMRSFALELLQKSAPVVYTHLISASHLSYLWNMGISTIPVIQNMSPGWTDPPSSYDNPHVPFVVGVSDAVSAELRKAGCPKNVVTLRHELQRFYLPDDLAKHRRELRNRYGLADTTFLIGMAGQFKSQKAYTRAVRVLHQVRQHLPAKLMILGGWDHDYGAGRAAYEATCRLAVELGVIADMIMPGDVYPTDPYMSAFDVFLNTSIYEGLSVALLEAIQTGCPVVTADAGGNREVLSNDCVLVAEGSDIDSYARGILNFANRIERAVPQKPNDSTLVPRLWALLAKHGVSNSAVRIGKPSGTLFLTENLEIGGAQKSLVNLLSRFPSDRKVALCVSNGAPLASYKQMLDEAQVPVFLADEYGDVIEKGEAILNLVDRIHVAKLCFWNVGPELKLFLTKVLSVRAIKLFDVSPGPMLLDELEAAVRFQRRVSLTAAQYFGRLDGFVAKYAEGVPPESLCVDRGKVHVIPNGVAPIPNFVPLPCVDSLLPRHWDPDLAIGTCCRIVPDKRIEFLLDTMKILATHAPGTSLTIVGGPDSQSGRYFAEIVQRIRNEGISGVFCVGPHDDVTPFLAQFRIFVMVSERQGCPNASLEAMAMGLPVVANGSGGVSEQVRDGVNGYLVSSPEEMAERVVTLQKSKRLREKLGRAGRAIAEKRFSLDTMVERYAQLLG